MNILPSTRGVYLLHFSIPYQHARHYVGYAEDIARRIEEHQRGQGARLTQVIVQAGITFEVARVWPGESRTFERRLHNRHGSSRFCPICKAAHDV